MSYHSEGPSEKHRQSRARNDQPTPSRDAPFLEKGSTRAFFTPFFPLDNLLFFPTAMLFGFLV